MAFESLSDKLQNIFKGLRGKGRLTEDDVKAALKEVKMALLEADVSFKVVKQFIKTVTERAIGQDVLNSLTPGQMVIKIVNEELTNLMGSETTKLKLLPDNEITVIMMMGLQGQVKQQQPLRLQENLKVVEKTFISRLVTFTDRQLLNSCRLMVINRVFRYLPWERIINL